MRDALQIHIERKETTVCHAWAVSRRDGCTLGFTDHDQELAFEGIVFKAESSMTARSLERTTGLSVDNTETVGALSDAAIREDDIRAGLYDGAEVRSWKVNWAAPEERRLVFRGTLGEIERNGLTFRAELRALSEALNLPRGYRYQRPCSAVLGDGRCHVDMSLPDYRLETDLVSAETRTELRFAASIDFPEGWFAQGRITVLSGLATGWIGVIRRDVISEEHRCIFLWDGPAQLMVPGDRLRLDAGCDKSLDCCRSKFNNILNFRGFPDIPGEDWLMAYPAKSGFNTGGSRRR